jgi:hypothetical protein
VTRKDLIEGENFFRLILVLKTRLEDAPWGTHVERSGRSEEEKERVLCNEVGKMSI